MEASERVSRQRRVMGLSLVGALSRLLYLVVNPHFRPGILSRETRGLFAAPQHQLHKTSHTLRLLVTLITITAAPRGTPRSGCRPPPGCDGGPVPRPPANLIVVLVIVGIVVIDTPPRPLDGFEGPDIDDN